MAKKDLLKGQLSAGSNTLPGGLQSLVRGGSTQDEKTEDTNAVNDEEDKRPVGRPAKNENVIHTSLVIDRDLYKKVKAIAVQEGKGVKDIIREAILVWLEDN